MRRVRTANEVQAALEEQHERLALLLGQSVHKIVQSKRAIFAARRSLGRPPLGKAR